MGKPFALVRAIFLLFIQLSSMFMAVHAQTNGPMPINKMVMEQWTSDDGLISNNLTSVSQTADGIIWVTSFNGVQRFDGKTFVLYDKENVDSLKGSTFYHVTDDADGVVFGSQANGVVRYKEGQLIFESEFPVSSVRRLFTDSKGKLWCGTNNEGLYFKENGKITRVDHDAFYKVAILDIYEDSNGRVWFATEGRGLVKLEDGLYHWYHSDNMLKDNNITSIIESNDGRIVFGSITGTYILDESSDSTIPIQQLNDTHTNDIIVDSKGLLWIATAHGLHRTDLETGYFETFDESNGLPANDVSSIMFDFEGSLWISSKKSGLIRMNLGSIYMLNESDGITSTLINVVDEFDGRIYIGSDDGSIFIKDGDDVKTLNLATRRRQVGIRDFMFDGKDLWVASYLGVLKYSGGNEKLYTTEDGLSSNLIRRILKSQDGSIWLAGRSGGAMVFKNGKVDMVYDTDNGLKSNFILAIAEDKQENVVLGTHSGGISIVNQDTVMTYVPNVGGHVIFNIYVDDENRYWLSTSVGLLLFDAGEFKKLEFNTSFKVEAIFDYVPDNAGNVWLSSNSGIIQIKQSDVDEFVQDNVAAIDARLYDQSDGMSVRECTGATRSTLMSNGHVYVPTLEGIAVVDPSAIRLNNYMPNIWITSMEVDNRLVTGSNKNIKPGKIRYEFNFMSTSYLATDHVRYKYQLSNVDENWITAASNKIEYTNLEPGNYTFAVKGSNNDGVWNETGDSIEFVVAPIYYQTWWFKLILALIVVFMFYLIFVWRVRRFILMNRELSKVNEELDKFVYSVAHDIRAPLTSIMSLTHIARQSKNPEEKDECLEIIDVSSEKLDGFIRDILDYSRNQRLELVPEDMHIEQELQKIIDSLRHLDKEMKINCTFETQVTHFVTDARRLRVVLKNIIANAFYYFDPNKLNSYIKIKCLLQNSNLKITISDNGVGIKESRLNKIFTMFYRGNADSRGSGLGLYIVKENIAKLGGTIAVDSKVNEGTVFTVAVPSLAD